PPGHGTGFAAAVGAVRARRLADRAGRDERAVAVRAPLRCGVALAVTPSGGVRAVAVRARRRARARGAALLDAATGARRGHRAAALVARRLRLRAATRRAGARDLDRGLRRA